ncbi:MAG: cytoskeleton protein RodZ [Gammaproteobacteria bacterium]
MAELEVKDLQQSNMSPGAMLRRQRQRMGWTVDEIASALCLSSVLIQNLEVNKFSDMGGSTFVLGYLRGYARLIGIDIEDSIIKHRAEIPEYVPDTENIPTIRNNSAKKTTKKRSILDISLIITGLVVLLTGAGLYTFYGEIVGSLKNSQPVNAVEQLATRASTKNHDSANASVIPSQDAATELERELTEEILGRISLGQELPMVLSYYELGVAGDIVRISLPPATEELRNHLVLIFDEGSWADVRDARGDRLLSQTVVKGSNVDLLGEPPFTVFLGNATGVRVKYKGRIESYSQTKKGLFARFVVGGNGAESE